MYIHIYIYTWKSNVHVFSLPTSTSPNQNSNSQPRTPCPRSSRSRWTWRFRSLVFLKKSKKKKRPDGWRIGWFFLLGDKLLLGNNHLVLLDVRLLVFDCEFFNTIIGLLRVPGWWFPLSSLMLPKVPQSSRPESLGFPSYPLTLKYENYGNPIKNLNGTESQRTPKLLGLVDTQV